MKTLFIMALACLIFSANAQTAQNSFTYGEFKSGYGITTFGAGLNERFEAGNFSTSGGGLTAIAAYRKFEKINKLHLGLKFKGLAAAPSSGDQGEELFFNFWGAAISAKFFPFSKTGEKGIFILGDYNFVTQFTQKYRKVSLLQFDHQFAIGSSITFGAGYQFFFSNRYGLVTSVEFDWASRTGEVQGVGDKNFRNTHLAFQVGFLF